jgi:hypothetical protein
VSETKLSGSGRTSKFLARRLSAPLVWRFSKDDSEHRTIRMRQAISINTTPGVVAATLARGGPAMLPDFIVSEHVRSGRLAHLLPAWTLPRAAYMLSTRRPVSGRIRLPRSLRCFRRKPGVRGSDPRHCSAFTAGSCLGRHFMKRIFSGTARSEKYSRRNENIKILRLNNWGGHLEFSKRTHRR